MALLSNENLIISVLLGFNSAGKRQESEHSIFNCYRKTLLELEKKGVDSHFLNNSCSNQYIAGLVKDFNKEKLDRDLEEMLKMIEKKEQSNQIKKQQTAVEWLEEQLIPEYGNFPDAIVRLFKQAKAMEKEYLERFYNQGYTQCSIEDLKPTSRDRYEDAEDYYNKIFKSE